MTPQRTSTTGTTPSALARRSPPHLCGVAVRRLDYLDAAARLDDLRVPPGNRLHPLTGDRAGQHAIRINDQYRICFTWTPEGPSRVEITDYH